MNYEGTHEPTGLRCGETIHVRRGTGGRREFYHATFGGNFERIHYCPKCHLILKHLYIVKTDPNTEKEAA